MRKSRVAFFGCVALLCASPTIAHADARADARARFKKGMDYVTAKKYDEAVLELRAAYELMPHANLLYNIGRAYAEGGKLEEALGYYKKYLDTNPADHEEVEQLTLALEMRIRRAALPTPVLHSSGWPMNRSKAQVSSAESSS